MRKFMRSVAGIRDRLRNNSENFTLNLTLGYILSFSKHLYIV